MRPPKLSLTQYVVIGTSAATLAVLPLTSASAAFDEGDYSLMADCGLDATLKVRGQGNGISVHGEGSMFVHTQKDGGEVVAAMVIDLGTEAADDNTVVTVTSADGNGLACASASDVDDATVAGLIGLDDNAALEDELSADDASTDEPSATEAAESEDEADDEAEAEKVVLCHKPDGANPHSIEISVDSLDAHLAHGDLEGECSEELLQAKDEAKQSAKDERDAAKAERKDKPKDKGDDVEDDTDVNDSTDEDSTDEDSTDEGSTDVEASADEASADA